MCEKLIESEEIDYIEQIKLLNQKLNRIGLDKLKSLKALLLKAEQASIESPLRHFVPSCCDSLGHIPKLNRLLDFLDKSASYEYQIDAYANAIKLVETVLVNIQATSDWDYLNDLLDLLEENLDNIHHRKKGFYKGAYPGLKDYIEVYGDEIDIDFIKETFRDFGNTSNPCFASKATEKLTAREQAEVRCLINIVHNNENA